MKGSRISRPRRKRKKEPEKREEQPSRPSEIRQSFRVALRSQPRQLAIAVQPFVNFGLVRKTFDVPDFRAGKMRFDLPFPLSNSLWDKGNAGRFFHFRNMRLNEADS